MLIANFLNGNEGEDESDIAEILGEEAQKREREEKACQQKEENKERRAVVALSSSAPRGRKWTKVQKDEENLEDELMSAPTEDIVARMIEQSVKIFKIADCSHNMKGSLVGELHGAVALMRAATSIMATRAREG